MLEWIWASAVQSHEPAYLLTIGIMEKKMEALGPFNGIYRAYIGIMEKKMETTIVIF